MSRGSGVSPGSGGDHGSGAGGGWSSFLAAYHAAHPAITEDLLLPMRSAAGLQPYAWLADGLPAAGIVWDVCCGSAPVADVVGHERYAGVDLSEAELAQAALRRPGAQVVPGDALVVDPPGPPAAVTVAMALMLLPLERFLARAAALLPSGASLHAMVPTREDAGATGYGTLLRLLGQTGQGYRQPLARDRVATALREAGFVLLDDEVTVFTRPLPPEDVDLVASSFYVRHGARARTGRGTGLAARPVSGAGVPAGLPAAPDPGPPCGGRAMTARPLRSFARVLADAAGRHGDRVVLVDPALAAEVSYRGLQELVDEAAVRLLRTVEPGARVAVLARNGLEQAVAALACSRAGLVHVGLPAGDPADRLAEVLDAAAVAALLVQPGLEPLAAAALDPGGPVGARGSRGAGGPGAHVLPTGAVLLGEGRAAAGAGPSPRRTADLPPLTDDAAAAHSLVATSGSTGGPKLVRLTGAMCDHAGRAYAALLGLGPDDSTPVHLPMWWVSGHVTQLASALVSGGSVVTMPTWSPAALVATVQKHGATWLDLVPTLWHGLLREGGFGAAGVPTLRAAVFGGAPAAAEVLAEVRRRLPGLALLDAYAMSEVPSPLTCLREEDALTRPASVGRALPGVQLEVVDDVGRPVPAGRPGAVAVRSPALTPGYQGGPVLDVDTHGRFRTGDLGVLDDEGFLTLTGRTADRMIRGGVTIHPLEVERALLASGLVVAAAVLPVPARLHGDDVGAVVVAAEAGPLDVAGLRAAVRARVGAHAVPVRVVAVAELPRTPNGKPDRDEVRRLLAGG